MEKKIWLGFIYLFALFNSIDAQQTLNNEIVVYQCEKEISGTEAFSFVFKKGDIIIVKLNVEKDKKLNHIILKQHNGNILWSTDRSSSLIKEYKTTNQGIYTVELNETGMGHKIVHLEILRKPVNNSPFNTAYMQKNVITAEEFQFNVDSVIGFNKPVITEKELKVFDKYVYSEFVFNKKNGQILGNLDGKCTALTEFKMDANKLPVNARIKSFNYSLESKLGGAKHWQIVEVGSSIAAGVSSLFLSPAAGFAITGGMVFIAPCEDYNTTMCFVSNRKDDQWVAREIYFSGSAERIYNKVTNNKKYNESNMDYNQKGQIANLMVSSALPPSYPYFVMANSYTNQARNWWFKSSAIYYLPKYKLVKAAERFNQLNTISVSKNITRYSNNTIYVPAFK
nr:hypothetical protein [uncultured Carboxylicivirga sp.]